MLRMYCLAGLNNLNMGEWRCFDRQIDVNFLGAGSSDDILLPRRHDVAKKSTVTLLHT